MGKSLITDHCKAKPIAARCLKACSPLNLAQPARAPIKCLDSDTQPNSNSIVNNDASWFPREFALPIGSPEQSASRQH